MPRRDPTLPSPDTATLSEVDLIARVKVDRDSAALLALVNRHTGIYFQVVNRYAATYPNAIKARDMDDDKLFNLDTFIQAYDPSRGTKLSTFIHDRTDWLCKGMLKRDARNPLSSSQHIYMASGSAPSNAADDVRAEVVLRDESSEARVTEMVNRDIAVDDILKTAHEVCDDPRFFQIWDYRQNLGMSWRAIGAKMNLSYEGCRKIIYQPVMDLVKERLAT